MPASGEKKSNISALTLCLGLTFGMLCMSYAAVPLYEIFCQVTGYAGTTQRADDSTGVVLNREITVRFNSNTSTDLDWDFKPKQRSITLKVETRLKHFIRQPTLALTQASALQHSMYPREQLAYILTR